MSELNLAFLDVGPRAAEHRVTANRWMRAGVRIAALTAMYPLEYPKVLMQLGFIPVMESKNRIQPSLMEYVGYIRETDGFLGLYRGFAPRLVGCFVGSLFSDQLANGMGLEEPEKTEAEPSIEEFDARFIANLKRQIFLSVSYAILSHPFHVVSLRQMAQFVGRETIYSNSLYALKEIYHVEGIMGLYAGLIPKLLYRVACHMVGDTVIHLLNRYLVKDKKSRTVNSILTMSVVSAIFYPFYLVFVCTAVSGSRLSVARPPLLPAYRSWLSCWSDLQERGELNRCNWFYARSTNSDA